jgi:hypothetical protein
MATIPTPEVLFDGDTDQVSPRIRQLVDLMEGKFQIPGTDVEFGMDAIVGLIPGIGDFIGLAIGSLVVIEGWRLKMPLTVLLRMGFNLCLDAFVGSVPVVGDTFDLFFKANKMNLELLEKQLEMRRGPKPVN